MVPCCRQALALYFSAPITGLTEEHPVRRMVMSLAEEVQQSGYELLDDYVFLPTQEESQRALAARIGRPYEELKRAPHHITDYDIGLVLSERCRWMIMEWSEKSDGVGAEAQTAYVRMLADNHFAVLVLVRDEVYEQRMRSPFLARFGDFPDRSRIVSYRRLAEAIDHVSAFVTQVLEPRLG